MPKPFRPATEEELRAQRRSWILGEASFGSDKDEALYRAALSRDDKAEMARLDAEAEKRRQSAQKYIEKNNL